ncbi:MAG: STAS domain-containing protein [Candidatus Omnitrophota bacterium]
MPVAVEITKKEFGLLMVSPKGSIDSETYEDFFDKINPVLSLSTKAVIMNMNDVTYVSSMGVSVLLELRKTVIGNEGIFIMVNLQPQVKKILELLKAFLDESIYKNVEEAQNYFYRVRKRK